MNTESGRQFSAFEATSLNNKFKQLWLDGIEARLVFETCNGQAWGKADQRRREWREAATVDAGAAVKATENEEEAEKVTEHENANEKDDQTSNSEKSQVTEENEHTVVIDDAEQVSAHVVEKGQVFVTEIDAEVCSDEEYYEEMIQVKPSPALNATSSTT